MNSLPKTATRQHCSCILNPGPSAPESSMLTTRLPSWCGKLLRAFGNETCGDIGQGILCD